MTWGVGKIHRGRWSEVAGGAATMEILSLIVLEAGSPW